MTDDTASTPPEWSGESPPRAPAGLGGERGLHPGVQIGWAVGRVVNALVLGTAAFFAGASFAGGLAWFPPALGALVFATLLALGLWHARRLFESWKWELRQHDVVAGYGVVWRVSRSIPRVRVQHVDIRSGPVDRALGLVEVSLHVAGSAGPVLTIPGLEPADAEALRELLLGSAKVS